jgi:hypothetical protein
MATDDGHAGLDPKVPGHQLFERLHLLEPAVERLEVQVVLSTMWVPAGTSWMRSTPPAAFDSPHPWACTLVPLLGRVGKFVAGATFEFEFRDERAGMTTRFEEIEAFAARHRIDKWVALDDDARGWPRSREHNLVKVDPDTALTESNVRELRQRLRNLTAVYAAV